MQEKLTSVEIDDLKEAFKESENEEMESEMIDKALKMSKTEVNYEGDFQQTINFVVEMGFTIEEATLAYSVVGDDAEKMLQYLYSLNYY